MSNLDDDIARGCLENGEPIEARWGTGWWSEEGRKQEPEPNFYGADCPYCGKEAIFVEFYGKHEFVECKHCGRKKMTTKPIPEMTDQEIDSALAEKMGWHAERVTLWFYNYSQFKPPENGEYLVFYRTDSNIKHSPDMATSVFRDGRWLWDNDDVLFWAHKVDRNKVVHG